MAELIAWGKLQEQIFLALHPPHGMSDSWMATDRSNDGGYLSSVGA
jgi:hypothetical protein